MKKYLKMSNSVNSGTMCGFMLPPPTSSELRSSGSLHSQ